MGRAITPCIFVISEHKLFEAIRQDLNDGFRFVPFVGAGLSQPSGVPVVAEFQRYLTYCLFRVVGIDLKKTLDERRKKGGLNGIQYSRHAWDPRTENWPGFEDVSSQPLTFRILDDLAKEVLQYLKRSLGTAAGGGGETVRASSLTMRETLEARTDWRSALRFLSALKVKKHPQQGGPDYWTVERTEPDRSVIDSVFVTAQVDFRQLADRCGG